MSVKYEGIIPPIVTPFTASGEIDEEKIRREMEICLDAGADGISVGGSTGEGPTLRDEELTQLIKIAREYVKEGSDKTGKVWHGMRKSLLPACRCLRA